MIVSEDILTVERVEVDRKTDAKTPMVAIFLRTDYDDSVVEWRGLVQSTADQFPLGASVRVTLSTT